MSCGITAIRVLGTFVFQIKSDTALWSTRKEAMISTVALGLLLPLPALADRYIYEFMGYLFNGNTPLLGKSLCLTKSTSNQVFDFHDGEAHVEFKIVYKPTKSSLYVYTALGNTVRSRQRASDTCPG